MTAVTDPGGMEAVPGGGLAALVAAPAAPANAPAATSPEVSQSLAARALPWCQEVAALVRERGRAKAADELDELMDRPPRPDATVVIAGEDKRGKSSLANNILQRPSLSPVGVETVTAAPISFYAAAEMEASVLYLGEQDPRPESVETALSLATLAGNPLNEHSVRAVQIGVPTAVLDGMVLVDTPGVGGLDSGHAALTLQQLRSADALLFVMEASAQLRGPEVRFLREAAARTSRVVFAMTKVDLYRGWRQIADDNRDILAKHAPRFANAPILPVANLLATKACRLVGVDDEGATELREESGVAELERVLRGLVSSDLSTLRSANLVQTGMINLLPIERAINEQVSALASPVDTQASLQAQKAKLVELNQGKAEWPQSLNVALRRLNLDRADRIQGGLANVRRYYEERLKSAKHDEQEQLPGEVVAALTAFAGDTNQWTMERLMELIGNVVGEVDNEVPVAETVQRLSTDLLTTNLDVQQISGKLKATDRITILSSYTSGHSMVALIASGGLGAVALGPIAIAAAVGLGSLFALGRFRVMKQQSFANQFKPWMNDQISRVQLNMNNNFQRTQIDVEVEVKRLLKAAFAEREKELNQAIAECQRIQAQEQGERQRHRQALTAQLHHVRELRIAGKQMLELAAG